jgi:tellurite resistance protein
VGHCPIKPDLPEVSPERLRAAVLSVLATAALPHPLRGRLPSSMDLRTGAEETVKKKPSDRRAAEHFQSLLEIGYLVASADGLADAERDALADLIERATGHVVQHDELRRHFTVLDQACEALGRHERIGRLASNFEDPEAREEALSFAALVAVSDGHLGLPEVHALVELGERLRFTDREVEEVLADVLAKVREALES